MNSEKTNLISKAPIVEDARDVAAVLATLPADTRQKIQYIIEGAKLVQAAPAGNGGAA